MSHSASHSVVVLLAALVLGPPHSAGQTGGGAGVIQGRVIAGDTGLPLPGAGVQLVSDETVHSGTARTDSTDARGAYEFTGLPAGVYRLVAAAPHDKPMYLSTDRVSASGVVELAAGDIRRDLDFSLPRAGAISGRLFDQFGQPIAAAAVHVFSRGTAGRMLTVPGSFSAILSDDYGRYRAWGFAAGAYYVRVDPRATTERATPSREGYVRTYYPNATHLAEASVVRLSVSEDLGNVDIQLDLTRTFQLSGIVLDPRGGPAPGAGVWLDFDGERAAGTGQQATSDDNGHFTFTNLPPADYLVGASYTGYPSGLGLRSYRGLQVMAAQPMRETIVGSDADGVTLRLRTGGNLRGTLATDAGGPPPFDLARIRIRALATEQADHPLAPRDAAVLDARSRFDLPGILVPVVVRVTGLPEAWFLSAVTHGSQNVIDTPIDVLGTDSDVRIVVSHRGAALDGSVEDAVGRPAALRDVRIFPDAEGAPATWTSNLRRALTDRSGHFHLEGLAPGDYLVVATDRQVPISLDEDAWAVIRRLGTPVSLREQARESVTLRLLEWPY